MHTVNMRHRHAADPYANRPAELRPAGESTGRIEVCKAVLDAIPTMTTQGQRVLMAVSEDLMRRPGGSQVALSPEDVGCHRAGYYRGLREVAALGVIAPHEPGRYWINPFMLRA